MGHSAPRNAMTMALLSLKPSRARLPPRRSRNELLLATLAPIGVGLSGSSAHAASGSRPSNDNVARRRLVIDVNSGLGMGFVIGRVYLSLVIIVSGEPCTSKGQTQR